MRTTTDDVERVESAGRDLARTAAWTLGARGHPARVVVLVGEGLTGAAGFRAARHLAELGMTVDLCLVGREAEPATGRAFARAGGRRVSPSEVGRSTPDLIVDALEGEEPEAAELERWLRSTRVSIVGLDVPRSMPGPRAPDGAPPPLWTMTLDFGNSGFSLGAAGSLLLTGD